MEVFHWTCTFTLSCPHAGGFPISLVQECFVSLVESSTTLPYEYLDTIYPTAHHGQNTGTRKHLTVMFLSANDKRRMTAYQHEAILGVKHAGAEGFVPVVEADHVETDGLRYRQEERQHPDRQDLNDGQRRDAHSLNSAPGCHGSVPARGRRRVTVQTEQMEKTC